MRAQEFADLPHLYLDMDGVQADFFTAWARWHGKKFGRPIDRYKEIGSKEEREQSISELNNEGPEFVQRFFANLPTLPGGMRLLAWLQANSIPFTILSSPLRNNEEASIQGKRTWLAQHVPQSSGEIFAKDKERWAVTQGQPNVLVDDYKKNIRAWNQAGGIGILYRDDQADAVIRQLAKIYRPEQRMDEIKATALNTYAVKIQLRNTSYNNMIDTTIQAKTPEMARRLLRRIYGDRNVIVGQPRAIK